MVLGVLSAIVFGKFFVSQSELKHLVEPSPLVLEKEQALEGLIGQATDGEHTPDQSLLLIQEYEKRLGHSTPGTNQWKSYFYAKGKRWDEAFELSAKFRKEGSVFLGGWLTDPQYLDELRKQPKFESEKIAFDELEKKQVDDLDFSKTGLWPAQNSVQLRAFVWKLDGPKLYETLSGFNTYRKPRKAGTWYLDSITFAAKGKGQDHVQIDYYVRIPKQYNAAKPNPALVWIKGAWTSNSAPTSPSYKAFEWDCPLREEAEARGYILIMPLCYKAVATQIPGNARLLDDIVSNVKRSLNVDDNRVYMSGHSNGGTSCYASACENPTPYACFYPINGWPTETLHFSNAANRQIESIDGEKDDLFLAEGKSYYIKLGKENGALWTDHWVPKGEHSYSNFIRPYAKSIFDHMSVIERHPLSPDKVWEGDQGGPDRVDWLQVLDVNPAEVRKDWHKEITSRLSKRTNEGVKLADSFIQNPSSGKAIAHYENNTFSLSLSRVTKVRLWIHSKMVDLSKPVAVIANGKEIYRAKVEYNPSVMMNNFLNTFDRSLVWCNYIDLDIPKD